MHIKTVNIAIAALGSMLLASASPAAVMGSQRLEPAVIREGEAARLTISESGNSPVTPPMVAGLEFIAITQSQRMESINGVGTTTTSVTYQVIPQQAGVFTIPSTLPGAQPLVLTVNPGGGRSAVQNGIAPQSAAPASSPLPAGATQLNADGSAFVRLRLAKHELYVGETVPVDIQVGMRDGFVASLNGLPTMNGDAFTLNKLSSEPVRSETVINGKPFTVLTWHSALAAIKPGTLSLTIETPLTVRMRTTARADASLLGDAGLGDLLNDPMFQNFFGTSTEKEVTVASAPTTFSVLELPAEHRPADFSGAVGHFTVSGGVSSDQTNLGDPVTVRMRVSGEGSFDRVNSSMLRGAEDWKTYSPTAAFTPDDDIGYRGEKTFEQPLIARATGPQSLPALRFSYYDPFLGHYVTATTPPLAVTIGPALGDAATPSSAAPLPASAVLAVPPSAAAAADRGGAGDADALVLPGLRADHPVTGARVLSLMPLYLRPRFLAVPAALGCLFSVAWWRERRRARGPALQVASVRALADIEMAARSGDSAAFFAVARAAVQQHLASRWQVTPESVTDTVVAARLGTTRQILELFQIADEILYSGRSPPAPNLAEWTEIVRAELLRGGAELLPDGGGLARGGAELVRGGAS